MDQQSLPHCRDTGAQGGNETQYLFSQVDIHPSDADVVRNPATGECVIPRSSKLLRIILATDRPFLCFVFPLLSFSDVSLRDVYWLLGPTFSSPLAGASISNLEFALPADLSGLAIELIADLTHRAADVPKSLFRLYLFCLPLALEIQMVLGLLLQRLLMPLFLWALMEVRVPLRQISRGSQKTGSPHFSSYLRRDSSVGCGGAVTSKIKHGWLF